jgi:ADP-ribose pyrophosphatase YjhB (NUDIX family)
MARSKVQVRIQNAIDLAESGADIGQVGAVPLLLDADNTLRVVLVTTRGSGRWTIPKGNPIKGLSLPRTAEVEAFEEAGLIGRAKKKPLGSYQFWKRQEDYWQLAHVLVFPLLVKEQLADFKEKGEREVRAFSLAAAELAVVEPGLKLLLSQVALGTNSRNLSNNPAKKSGKLSGRGG